MGFSLRSALPAALGLTLVSIGGCGGSATPPNGPSPSPSPAPRSATANAYILPNAVSKNDWAFGDEPVVVYKGERLRWINADTIAHVIVADSPNDTDFNKTEELGIGAEQSFIMTKLGMTKIHCSIHPNMTGSLIVRDR